jgi:acetyl/propionyl-CoA carboxylase alpha subunit
MGSKTGAREIAIRAACRSCRAPSAARRAPRATSESRAKATRIGYPLMVKAVAGGGGKGMRVVDDARRAAERGADGALGGRLRVRRHARVLRAPRHEAAPHRDAASRDQLRHRRPFVERECSIQRRHQKVVEESPSMAVDAAAAPAAWPSAAAAVAARAGYTNAGTIEFLLDEDGSFYFLEMNTRLQVEHPVTEMVTSLDLVHWQIRIARGERLTIDPDARAHAARARHRMPHLRGGPGRGFMPSPGLRPRDPSAPAAPASATTAACCRATPCRSSTTR